MVETNGIHSNWIRMEDIDEVVRGLKNSARFQGPPVDEAVDRVMDEGENVVYHSSGIDVEVREDGIEYFVRGNYDDAALNEFTELVLPRSDYVHEGFVEDVRADVENAYAEVKTDEGHARGSVGDVRHTPPDWTGMDNPSL
ncbi:MAG: hypothetical protein ABEJ64_02660 [Candidatus Nanohaloarchaea archaeon]